MCLLQSSDGGGARRSVEATMPTSDPPSAGRPAELRIALVCYGGVSLAVYMHGVTKELHKLVRASRAFDADPTDNPFPATGSTEHHYFQTLRDLDARGRKLSVAIDIISGTSAGGINGVVLAKALAVNAEQEELKRLWIDEGDLRKLLRTKAPGGLRTKALFAIIHQLRHATSPTSPLKGERMSVLLRDALKGMDESRGHGAAGGVATASTLLPGNGRLELFVTTTDLNGFEMLVPSGIGGASQRDRFHAQVVQFDTAKGTDAEFGPPGNPALAFSARATSSFPGAFAPVSATSFHEEADMPAPDLEGGRLRFEYEEPGQSAQYAWFADGGILDNAPFDHVIDAIAARRAESEVLRKVIYIQPDPGRPLGVRAHPESSKEEPTDQIGWLTGLVKVVGAKGSHPILRELLKLRDMNLRIAQVGDITTRQMAQMEEQIGVALEKKGMLPETAGARGAAGEGAPAWSAAAAKGLITTGPQQVQDAIDAVREHAAQTLEPTWATYQRLKVDAAGRRLADEISHALVYPRDSGRSSFVRAAIAAWSRKQAVWTNPDPSALAELLRGADVPYRERRILFLLAGVNGLYKATDGPSRESLDMLKVKAWKLLEELREVTTRTIADAPPEMTAFLSKDSLEDWLFYDPSLFAEDEGISTAFRDLFFYYRDALAADTTVQDGGAAMWTFFESSTRDWRPEYRSGLLSRYIGFPMWDAVIFPTVSLSELPQFTPIPVSQFSPLAASVLKAPPAGGKLRGTSFFHFSGFFEAGWRENDYLWGRLDGAELILRSLRDTVRETPQKPTGTPGPVPSAVALEDAGGPVCIGALRAVLDSEGDLASADARKVIDDVRSDLDSLQAGLPPGS
jgi:patatin-related protein